MNENHRIDFATTNFGFGPVAKLVAVARALRRRLPQLTLRLLGSGHVLSFGTTTGAFDHLVELDLDHAPETLAEATEGSSAVVNSLNFAALPLLTANHRRVFQLDSLAWLWPQLPADVDLVERYIVQGFLLDTRRERLRQLPKNRLLVGPLIDPEIDNLRSGTERNPQLAVLSLGGCCNPFVPARDFVPYAVETVRGALQALRPQFSQIEVYTNSDIAEVLRSDPGNADVTIQHSPQRDFLRSLARCGLLLTTPGITSTLECVALQTPIKFLPPNNLSQYRILERYHESGVLSTDVRLSSFDCGVEITRDEPQHSAVPRIGSALAAIKPNSLSIELAQRLEQALDRAPRYELDRIRALAYSVGSGTRDVVDSIVTTCRLS